MSDEEGDQTQVPQSTDWRLTVRTEGTTGFNFKIPCGDGSLTILDLTHKVAERVQRLLPKSFGRPAQFMIEKMMDADGCILFPEDQTNEVLDDRGTVRAFVTLVESTGNGGRQRQHGGAGVKRRKQVHGDGLVVGGGAGDGGEKDDVVVAGDDARDLEGYNTNTNTCTAAASTAVYPGDVVVVVEDVLVGSLSDRDVVDKPPGE